MCKFIFLLAFLSSNLLAQLQPKITPDLQKILDETPPVRKVTVMAVMSAKCIFPPYTVVVKEQRDQIIKERINALRQFAQDDQTSIVKFLVESDAENTRSNLVKNYIGFSATPAVIKKVAERDDVSYILPFDKSKFSDESVSDGDLNIIDSTKDFRTNIERLSDANPITRRNSIIYLANEKNTAALEHIIKMLSDENSLVRRTAAEALSNFRASKGVVPPLLGLLKTEKDVAVKYVVIKVLGDIGSASAVEPLKSILSDPYPLFRGEAVKSLGKINDPATYGIIVNMIKDEAEGVRIAAMEVSAKLKLKSALSLILKNLDDPVAHVRKAAYEAMGQLGGEDEVKILRKRVIEEPDETVKSVAMNSIELIRSRLESQRRVR